MSDTSSGSGQRRMTNRRGGQDRTPPGYSWDHAPAADGPRLMAGEDDWRQEQMPADDDWQQNSVTGEWERVRAPGQRIAPGRPGWAGPGTGTDGFTRGHQGDAFARGPLGASNYASPDTAEYDSSPISAADFPRPRAEAIRPARGARKKVRRDRATTSPIREIARTWGTLVSAAALAAAFCVAFVITFGANNANRNGAGPASTASVTHLTTLAGQYNTLAAAADHELSAEITNFAASQNGNLPAAKSALLAEVATSRAFDSKLASWLADWKKTYAAAQAAQHQSSFPLNIPYPSSVAAKGQSLIQADKAREGVLIREASSVTVAQLQSFSGQDQAAGSALANQVAALRMALQLPPQ